MPNSLLLTLLSTTDANPAPITRRTHRDLNISEDAEKNIDVVFQAIKDQDHPKRDLIKDVARKELYEALYSIIHKGYDDKPMSPDELTLNRAIAMALETAIRGASQREAEGKLCADDGPIITLRKALREEIIKALDPK
jgi:hypothetical protein